MAHSKAAASTTANSRTSIRLLKAPEVKRVVDCMLMCGPKAPNIFAYQKAEQLNMPKTSFVRYVWDGGGIRSAVASFFGLRAVSMFLSPIVTCMVFCPVARMQERFNKTGKVEAPRGRPARVTAEQMYAIKEQVEEGVGDTETLSKRAFVQLANDAALLNARLEGRGINFTELAVNTVKKLSRSTRSYSSTVKFAQALGRSPKRVRGVPTRWLRSRRRCSRSILRFPSSWPTRMKLPSP